MTVPSAFERPMYFGRCSACLDESTYYRVLRVREAWNQTFLTARSPREHSTTTSTATSRSALERPSLPNLRAARCLRGSGRPRRADSKQHKRGMIGSGGDVVLSWFVDPCRMSSHERPGRREEPVQPEPKPDPTRPKRHENIPNWCWVAGNELRGPRSATGSKCRGFPQPGEITEIWSHRLGGGVGATVEFADGTWVRRSGLFKTHQGAADIRRWLRRAR